MLQCIIFLIFLFFFLSASLDCQTSCQSTTPAVWPYYCVIIKWKPGDNIFLFDLNLTNDSVLIITFLFKQPYCVNPSIGSPRTETCVHNEWASTGVCPSWENWRQYSGSGHSFLCSSSACCWMLDAATSVQHPFDAKKTKRLSPPAHWQMVSRYTVCILLSCC